RQGWSFGDRLAAEAGASRHVFQLATSVRRRGAGDRVDRAVERLARLDAVEPLTGPGGVLVRQLKSEVVPDEFLGDRQRCSAAGKGVEDQFVRPGAGANDSAEHLFRHLAAMPPLALLEGAVDPRVVPGVFMRMERGRQILRSENPAFGGRVLDR